MSNLRFAHTTPRVAGDRVGRFLAAGLLVLSVLVAGACGQGENAGDPAAQSAEQWEALKTAKEKLTAARAELAELKATEPTDGEEGESEEDAEDEGAEGEGGEAEGDESAAAPMTAEELEAAIAEKQEAVTKMADAFYAQVIEFINTQDIVVGEDLTDIQRQAFDMKAQEDVLLAKEYIDKGGEYQRAIDIYIQALHADPENAILLEAKAEAEELRYMTEERLAQVEKNMNREQVRELLGIPKSANIREFDNDVIGWFYPKEEPRTAAAVFFRKKKGTEDEFAVYKTDFNAIEAQGENQADQG